MQAGRQAGLAKGRDISRRGRADIKTNTLVCSFHCRGWDVSQRLTQAGDLGCGYDQRENNDLTTEPTFPGDIVVAAIRRISSSGHDISRQLAMKLRSMSQAPVRDGL